jgi:hypothetical protein
MLLFLALNLHCPPCLQYFDVVSEVEPKRQELAAANAKLEEANVTLAAVQAKVGGWVEDQTSRGWDGSNLSAKVLGCF